MKQWHKHLLRLFVISVGTTVGVVLVLLITAKNPDIDEFTRGIPAGIVGAIVGWVFRGIIPITITTEENIDAD